MKGLAPARHKSKITALLAAWKAVFNWQFRPQDTTKVLFEFFFQVKNYEQCTGQSRSQHFAFEKYL